MFYSPVRAETVKVPKPCPGEHGEIQKFRVRFSRELTEDISIGTNEDQGGPGANGIVFPDGEIRIVHYRVDDFVAINSQFDIIGQFFTGKFGAMDTDHHHGIGKFFFYLFESWDNVNAVDTTISPKIQDDHLAL
jgi:hypothetical protein